MVPDTVLMVRTKFMSELTIFDRAIAAHAKWKYRLFQAVKTGKSEWTVPRVRAADRCDFGAWLQALPVNEKMCDQCDKVKSLHAEFHHIAAEVLQMALEGRKEEAEAAISLGSHFSAVSAELTMAISEWSKRRENLPSLPADHQG
jgi:hypothetical protein